MNKWTQLRGFLDDLVAAEQDFIVNAAHLRPQDRQIIEERIFVYTGIIERMDQLDRPSRFARAMSEVFGPRHG